MEFDLKKIIIFGIILLLIIGGIYLLFFKSKKEAVAQNAGLNHNFLDFNLNNKCGSKNKDFTVDVNINDKETKLICTNLLTYDYTWQDYNVYLNYKDENKTTEIKDKLDYNIFDGKSCLISELGIIKKDSEGNTFSCKEDLLGETGYSWKLQVSVSTINNTPITTNAKCIRTEEFNTILGIDGKELICLKNEFGGGFSWKERIVEINDPQNLDLEGEECEMFKENNVSNDVHTNKLIVCMFRDGRYVWIAQ
ncbi:MAG: hypothetical protein WCX82_03050 [archaeon]|jgi:hypothetical protein